MADVAWVTLTIWPWDDAWLAEDDELRAAFAELELVDTVGSDEGTALELVGGMNGQADYDDQHRMVISGEMRGGSYEIREESNLLELLQERGIAYHLVGDAKFEWVGDEIWWHPGREKPFDAVHGNEGRFLDEGAFR